MSLLIRTFIAWLPLGIAVTLICGVIYGTVQQNYRQTLNDPQIQIAEDTSAELSSGASTSSVVPQAKINIAQSLAPWVAVYDVNGNVIASDGVLNGSMPQPPKGVFTDLANAINQTGENRLTWQPASGVRQAIVVIQIQNGGFVVAGRNMREVEGREQDLGLIICIGWLSTIAATFIAQGLALYLL
jgi:hypothetical protein